MRNQVSMRAGIVRGEEVIRYPADEMRLLGIDHGNVQVVEYLSTDREARRSTRTRGTRSRS
jgi:hypothetical protein